MDTVHIYKDEGLEWRWKRTSENGQIVADSGEGYTHRSDCEAMAHTVNGEEGNAVTYVYDPE